MPKRTIPEIAEELRAHINSDNDAPRLIAEHVLPLLGIELSPKELKDVQVDNDDLRTTLKDTAEELKDLKTDNDDLRTTLKGTADELTDALSDMDDENYGTAKGQLRDLITRLRNP